MIFNAIKQAIDRVVQTLGLPSVDYSLEHPALETHGDYSTNVAMLFGQNPRELAQKIVAKLMEQKPPEIDRIEIAGPGFINFHLSQNFFLDTLNSITSNPNYGHSQVLQGKKVMVEYTDPNPFKEFHIGHLYSNVVGESIAKMIESQGATVWRADFFGDVGMHVAKSIWGLLQKFSQDNLSLSAIESWPLKQRIEYLGQAYALGATKYETDKDAAAIEEMKQLNFLIFKAAQETVLPEFNELPQINYDQYIKDNPYTYETIKELYVVGRKWSLEYFETIYARLGTKFDGYYPESRTGEYGYGMVLDGLNRGIFEKGNNGAIIFPGEKYGLHNRVFINALGLPTYEAKDFGNAAAKNKDFPYDLSINVTGNEISEYFRVVLKAMVMYRPDLGEKTKHIGHGMVRLPEGKMSSRTGKILRGEWLLDEAKQAVLGILKNAAQLSQEEKEDISETVGQGAVKYALLKQNIGGNIAFDFSSSVTFEGNSGPYLQYTYARSRSVVGQNQISPDLKPSDINPQELALLKWLYRLPEIVFDASNDHAPHLLCTYLYELAQRFNTFYNQHSILGSEKKPVTDDQKQFRLALTAATAQVLKNGLNLLGIKAPEKM